MVELQINKALLLAIFFITLSESHEYFEEPEFLASNLQLISYPEIRRNESVVDEYFGTRVPDPYRWLETTHTDEVKSFIEKQNNLTLNYLLEEDVIRNEITEDMTKISNAPKFEYAVKRGLRYFYIAEESNMIRKYYVQDGRWERARLLVDPGNFSGTPTYMDTKISPDGNFITYCYLTTGAWNNTDILPIYNLRIRDVGTGEDFSEVVTVTAFNSLLWTKDSSGFFYVKPSESPTRIENFGKEKKEENLYYHHVGTSQQNDSLVLDFNENPVFSNSVVDITDDGKYLLVTPHVDAVRNNASFYIVQLERNGDKGFTTALYIKPVITQAEFSQLKFLTNEESTFYFLTNSGAPKCQIVAIQLEKPNKQNWLTIVPENPQYYLKTAIVVDGDKIILKYFNGGNPPLNKMELRYLLNGTFLRDFSFENGEDLKVSGNKFDHEILVTSSRRTSLPEIYTLDVKNPESNFETFKRIDFWNHENERTEFTVSKVNFTGFNGTTRAMHILHRKDFEQIGQAPTLLVDELFFFNSNKLYLTFLQKFDGIIAIPFFGSNRESISIASLSDFIAAGEYLVSNYYTRPARLILRRAGYGGMYAAAIINRRPDLFGAAIFENTDFDLLRYHKFKRDSLWETEFGTSTNKRSFKKIKSISPLHNIKHPQPVSVQYPAIFVLSEKNGWYSAQHSYKYIAELQHTIGSSYTQTNPLLLKVDSNNNNTTSTDDSLNMVKKESDIYTFLNRAMGLKIQ